MEVIQVPVGNMQNLAYIVFNPQNMEAIAIDVSWQPELIADKLKEKKLNLRCILLTHGHFDHVNGIEQFKHLFDVPVYMSKYDEELIDKSFQFISLEDEQLVPEIPEIKMLHTPGHTKGSVCWLTDGKLFTGDTLFIGCCGRIDFAESQPQKMYDSLRKINKLPSSTKIFPGHSYNGLHTTLQEEQQNNVYLKAAINMTEEEFLRLSY